MRHLWLIAIYAGVLASAGCSGAPIAPSPTPPPGPALTAPNVYAGADVWLPLPMNTWVLEGIPRENSSTVTAPPTATYSWKKVSGPASYAIESPGARRTKVVNLEQGTYEFEFALTVNGSTTTDTVKIHVYQPRAAGANEILFKNVPWLCPMGCSATPPDFQLAGRTPIRVLLKPSAAEAWFEAKPETQLTSFERYVYSTRSGGVSFYTDDDVGTVDIWIVF
jgi:hypothetical protein